MAMRLVLRQPSPNWHTFHVEEIHVFAEPPRRVPWLRRGNVGHLGPQAGGPVPASPSIPVTAAAPADQNVSHRSLR